MNRSLWWAWEFRPVILLGLLTLGGLYSVGWFRLRQRSRRSDRRRGSSEIRHSTLGERWRPFAYWLGLLSIVIALMSPIDVLSGQLFLMHMVQHLLLVMVAPPLLLLANPLPYLMWGLPAAWRRPAGRPLQRQGIVRHALRRLTTPAMSWMIFVAFYWGWHDPGLYNLSLTNSVVHDLEHLTFFMSAMLIWWHITAAGPRLHSPFSLQARALYAVSFVPPNMIAGMAIVFAQAPLYPHYLTVPRLWGLTPLADQQWSGVIMWVPGSMMFIVAGLILLYRRFAAEAEFGPVSSGGIVAPHTQP